MAAARIDGIARRAEAFLGQVPRLVDDRNERLQCQPGLQIESLSARDGAGDRHSRHESRLTHGPREVREPLRTLLSDELGPNERADVGREIRSWEYHVAALQRKPISASLARRRPQPH